MIIYIVFTIIYSHCFTTQISHSTTYHGTVSLSAVAESSHIENRIDEVVFG
jgi:hypothetical protein